MTNKNNLNSIATKLIIKIKSNLASTEKYLKSLEDNVNYFTFIRDLSRNKLKNVSAQAFATNKKLTAL